MATHQKPLLTAMAAVLFMAALCGCSPAGPQFIAAQVKRMTPAEFYGDPLQVRLAVAVDQDDIAAVDAAVRDGANVNAWGRDGFSLLYWAMARDRTAGFEALVKNGADLTAEYRDPVQVSDSRLRDWIIRLALTADNPEFLRIAMRHGFDPNYMWSDKYQETLLFLAASDHAKPAMEILLEAGADMNHQDHLGNTPLMDAVMRCDYATVWFFLHRGADPMIKNQFGGDLAAMLKEYGSRGVGPDSSKSFEQIVAELVSRGLLTRQDIVEADKPKTSGKPGVEIIYHEPGSEVGQAIRAMDRAKQEATRRGNK